MPVAKRTAPKSIRSFPLAAAHPLTVLSWSEALHASGSRRACRMHIGRIACSPVALTNFPEFAQAVRHGVPGTRGCMPFKWPNPPVAANSSGFRQLYSPDISGMPGIYSVSWDSAAPLATTRESVKTCPVANARCAWARPRRPASTRIRNATLNHALYNARKNKAPRRRLRLSGRKVHPGDARDAQAGSTKSLTSPG